MLKTKTISLRITLKEYEVFKAYAKRKKLTLTQLILTSVKGWIKNG